MDIKHQANTCNHSEQGINTYRKLPDGMQYTLNTYIRNYCGDNKQQWIEIAPHYGAIMPTMMANISTRDELNAAKRIHRFGDASESDKEDRMVSAGRDHE